MSTPFWLEPGGGVEVIVIVWMGISLIIPGLIITKLSGNVYYPFLISVVYWTGVILVIVGLVILLTPVLVWLNYQLRTMLA